MTHILGLQASSRCSSGKGYIVSILHSFKVCKVCLLWVKIHAMQYVTVELSPFDQSKHGRIRTIPGKMHMTLFCLQCRFYHTIDLNLLDIFASLFTNWSCFSLFLYLQCDSEGDDDKVSDSIFMEKYYILSGSFTLGVNSNNLTYIPSSNGISNTFFWWAFDKIFRHLSLSNILHFISSKHKDAKKNLEFYIC